MKVTFIAAETIDEIQNSDRTGFSLHLGSSYHRSQQLGSGSASRSRGSLSRSAGRLGSTSRSVSRLESSASASSRPFSCVTFLGAPPEEEEEVEDESKESLKEEDSTQDLQTILSGTFLSSGSNEEDPTFSSSLEKPGRRTPPTSPQREEQTVNHSVSCLKRLHTAASSSASYRERHSRFCRCSSGHESNMVETKVIYASSHDPNFPPSAMLDGRPDTFWASTGLYPQVVVVSLPGITSVDNLTMLAYNVRKVSVARSLKTQPTDFEEVTERELPHTEGKLQSSVLSSDQITAAHLRITIIEGHGHFCSVHKVSVAGSGAPGNAGGQVKINRVTNNSKTTALPSSPSHQRTPMKVMSLVDDDDDDDSSEYMKNRMRLPNDEDF